MTNDDRNKRQEEAEKSQIIEMSIVFPLEAFNYELQVDRKAGLARMSLAELRELAKRLKIADSAPTAIHPIVAAIANSDRLRREADDRKWDAIDGGVPATVSMDI